MMGFFSCNSYARHNQKGFSLLELTAAMIVSGLLISALVMLYKPVLQTQRHETTKENLRETHEFITSFVTTMGRYPCPADPRLPMTDANAGIEVCRVVEATSTSANCDGVPNADDVTPGIDCNNTDSRDGDGDGDADAVLYGVIPFRTLALANLGDSADTYRSINAVDGYNSMLAYAVTEHMTRGNIFRPTEGAIHIQDESGYNLITPEGSAHYVLYSLGENRRGAYARSGKLAGESCRPSAGTDSGTSGTPPPTESADLERENCDNQDAVFVKSYFAHDPDVSRYYDDTLYYKAAGSLSFWSSRADEDNEAHIFNNNVGNVGVGTNVPQDRLHVVGNMSAEGGVIVNAAQDLADIDGDFNTDEYYQGMCDPLGDNCFDPDKIAGNEGMACASTLSPQVAYAIHENTVLCRDVEWNIPKISCFDADPDPQFDADGNQIPRLFLRGFSTTGQINCCPVVGDCVLLP